MAEKTKVPLRRMYANDLIITIDGAEFRPHFGEYIEFTPIPTLDEVLLLEEMVAGRAEDEMTATRTRAWVEKRLKGWDWSNDANEPLPPPTPEVLRELDIQEFLWIQRAMKGWAGTHGIDDDSPNLGSIDSSMETPPPPPPGSSPVSARSSPVLPMRRNGKTRTSSRKS